MQPLITKDLLKATNIKLPEADTDSFIAHLNDTLQERIGLEITETLDDEQLQQLLDLQKTGNPDDTTAWLQANVPDLEDIVKDEVDILLGEVAENAPAISAAV